MNNSAVNYIRRYENLSVCVKRCRCEQCDTAPQQESSPTVSHASVRTLESDPAIDDNEIYGIELYQIRGTIKVFFIKIAF